jgi:hypothetical protein
MLNGAKISSLIFAMNEDQRDEFFKFIEKLQEQGIDEKLKKQYSSFTCQDILDDIESTTVYERERKRKQEAAELGVSTIPNEKWGVHVSHCCVYHGCKYGDADCPVVLKLEEQKYPCETCTDGVEEDPNRIFKKKK